MTLRLNAFTQAACCALLFMLTPAISLSQGQNPPATVPQPETTSKAAPQKQDSSVIDPGEGKQQPATENEEALSLPDSGQNESGEGAAYTIKQGDTLWDIANTFLKDPFLWPFIWKANPHITNPDLIYAGNKLSIPNLAPVERAMQTPVTTAPKEERAIERQVQAAPKKEAAPAEQPKPAEGIASAEAVRPKPAEPVPAAEAPAEAAPEAAPTAGSTLVVPEELPSPIIDKYTMLSAGFVNNIETGDMIVGGADKGKTEYGYDDIVYVHVDPKENVAVGDKFLIYVPLERVKHPRTGERYGRLIRGLGVLQITAKDTGGLLTARISLSFDAIERKSLLTPYQEPSLVYYQSQKKAKDISGYILEVADTHALNGQTDIVYLDKGTLDGVEPGDRFLVYAEPEKKGFPRRKIGEVAVFLVKDRTSTAVVSASDEEIGKGEAIDYKK
jgi:LysM repeat protein